MTTRHTTEGPEPERDFKRKKRRYFKLLSVTQKLLPPARQTVPWLDKEIQNRRRDQMATVQENWQTNCTSISQRTKYIFNRALLSDVKFIVPVSNGESERVSGKPE